MSRTFSIKSGSFDSLNVSVRCGCRAKARQIRLTAVWLRPLVRAIDRVLQCVASRGVDSNVIVTTRSTSSSEIRRGAPGRGSSSSPSSRRRRNRRRHSRAVAQLISWSWATWRMGWASALAKAIRARIASACAVVGRHAARSNVARSSALSITGGIARPFAMGASFVPEYERRDDDVQELLTQDTSLRRQPRIREAHGVGKPGLKIKRFLDYRAGLPDT